MSKTDRKCPILGTIVITDIFHMKTSFFLENRRKLRGTIHYIFGSESSHLLPMILHYNNSRNKIQNYIFVCWRFYAFITCFFITHRPTVLFIVLVAFVFCSLCYLLKNNSLSVELYQVFIRRETNWCLCFPFPRIHFFLWSWQNFLYNINWELVFGAGVRDLPYSAVTVADRRS